MFVAAMLLAFVATLRVAFGLFHLFWFGPSAVLAVAIVTAVLSGAYLVWLFGRARDALTPPPVPTQVRWIVVGYGLLVLLVLPVAEVVTYRALA